MKRFIEGADRSQAMLLPASIDDYVSGDNVVRAVDAFVDGLDLGKLGFSVVPAATGRPGYHPSTLLKIYLYGYLNQIQSSRRLERECGRNIELIWLTGHLAPDFKTIADFRKDNGAAIREVCRQFVALCRDLHLINHGSVAIDGSRFKALNSKENNFTREKLRRFFQEIDAGIARYLAELDRADEVAAATGLPACEKTMKTAIDKIARLKAKQAHLHDLAAEMERRGDTQISLTDPDARSMASTWRKPRVVGYNVQSAVDTKHHLIVAHDVNNIGSDRGQLSIMAGRALQAMQTETLDAVADKGYYKSEEIATCDRGGVAVIVPKPTTSNAKARGQFDRNVFIYDADSDTYICPAGEQLTYRMTTKEGGKVMHRYWTAACGHCPIKHHCTEGKQRRVTRWEHEDILERVQARLDNNPDAMKLRGSTVEHPFGTIKAWMGATHFKMKTLKHVATEMALHVLAYNMRRVIAIVGVAELIKATVAFLSWLTSKTAPIPAV